MFIYPGISRSYGSTGRKRHQKRLYENGSSKQSETIRFIVVNIINAIKYIIIEIERRLRKRIIRTR